MAETKKTNPGKTAFNPKIKAKVKAEYARIVAGFVSDEYTRYYLSGIAIQKHPKVGVIITATDGHRLVSFHDIDGYIKGGDTLLLKITPDIMRALKKRGAQFLCHDGLTTHVLASDPEQGDFSEITPYHFFIGYNEPIDGTFPNWGRVIPKKFGPVGSIGFNPKYVAEFAAAFGKKGYSIHFSDQQGPAVVLCSHYPMFIGVLMPLRDGTEGNKPIPSWLEDAMKQPFIGEA